MKKVIIIGAGIGGLATANLLAKAGYKVSIYEKNQQPGGRAGSLKLNGFTFDTGPSWYLMPEVFEHYYTLLGEDISRHLQLQRLDPAYKVFFENAPDAPVVIRANIAQDGKTFEAIESGASQKLKEYLVASRKTYEVALQRFLYTNFDTPRAFINSATLRSSKRLAVSAMTPIDKHVSTYFTDNRLKQIMEYPMVFLGTSPFEAPALYSLMSHLDFNQGVFYPLGGMYTIIESLVKIGKKLGVKYHYNSDVQQININGVQATGITLASGATVQADIVISNADLHFTETALLPVASQTYGEKYWQKKQAGPSALLMYLGVKGKLPQLSHHNLVFAEDWQTNFGDIFNNKTWPKPASMYICKPSETDSSVAPKGFENIFILVPAPAGKETSADELAELSDAYLDQLAAMAKIPDLTSRIVTKQLVGPNDFVQNFNAWQGTALGLSHRLSQSAFFRPANKSKHVKNLYYVGGNSVPGIGLPMCLIGAELIIKRLTRDHSSEPLAELAKAPDA